MVKFDEANSVPPSKAFLEAMDQLAKAAANDGCVMVEGVGLSPTAAGARIRLAGGNVAVTDGPFAEAKEVVGGYAIFEVESKAKMLEWAKRFMELHRTHIPGWEGECEIRQMFGPGEKPCDQVREMETAAAV
jgi:hypothetical protein